MHQNLRQRIFNILRNNIKLALVLKIIQTPQPSKSAPKSLSPFKNIPYLLRIGLNIRLKQDNKALHYLTHIPKYYNQIPEIEILAFVFKTKLVPRLLFSKYSN